MAVSALRRGKIKKIVLVRPAVEAGEHLGFLPGDLEAKINPYLRPLLDALHDLMDYDQIRRYMGNDLIEIAPLAYMRGRTLNDAVIILDEGQNATVPQMKMFLTRMGQNARIVVTGDVTQVDLPPATVSGLADAVERLRDVPGIATVLLDKSDIVRHPLVQAIVNAYEATEPARGPGPDPATAGSDGRPGRRPDRPGVRRGDGPPSMPARPGRRISRARPCRSRARVGPAHFGEGRGDAPLTARVRDASMSFGKRRPKSTRAQLRPSNPIALQHGRSARQRDRLARLAVVGIAVLAIAAIVHGAGPPFTYRLGQRPEPRDPRQRPQVPAAQPDRDQHQAAGRGRQGRPLDGQRPRAAARPRRAADRPGRRGRQGPAGSRTCPRTCARRGS